MLKLKSICVPQPEPFLVSITPEEKLWMLLVISVVAPFSLAVADWPVDIEILQYESLSKANVG